ncbi:MAG: glycosyltransferase family 2 protein [Deltaproteobacteria bacterium]|nr:glycosyltransferase family 2 protein [Deltaproteobacteria bacterium]
MPRGISVVVPCYNSEGSIGLLVEALRPVLATLAPAFEIILVDDASRDGTAKVIADLARRHDDVSAVTLMRNYGQHAALLCGIRAARYDVTITMDDDLQHPPDELPRLVSALTDDLDVVYGSAAEEPHGFLRGIASRITKRVLRDAMGVATAGNASAWRVFRTRLRDAFDEFRGSFVSIDVLLTWGTQRFTSIKVRHDPRTIGSSNYTLRKLLVHAINMMTGFTSIPLRLASWLGFALTAFGAVILVFVLGRYLIDSSSPPGFPFLACIIAVFSGAQLLCLGIIGEYLGRAHFRLLDRPPYQVRTSTGGGPGSGGEPTSAPSG